MGYLGNTPENQAFTPRVDYFSGNASATAFTLSFPVASVAQVQAVIENVPQNPGDAYTVSGNTITFTSAPPSGTNNIYVYYTSPITQVVTPGQGTVGTAQLQSGLSFSQWVTSGANISYTTGSVGIGTSSPAFLLDVQGVVARVGGATAGSATAYTQYGSSATDLNNYVVGVETGSLAFYQGEYGGTSTERMRIDSSGNLGIGTSSPLYQLSVGTAGSGVNTSIQVNSATNSNGYLLFGDGTAGDAPFRGYLQYDHASDSMMLATAATERMRIDSSGNLLFNSGYGSVATAYGCRAWVNFNGTGTPAIRGSGNVTSITDNGTGQYTVNLTTAMPDANYATSINSSEAQSINMAATWSGGVNQSTSSFKIYTRGGGNVAVDPTYVSAAVFR